jgi:hypothetical protein
MLIDVSCMFILIAIIAYFAVIGKTLTVKLTPAPVAQ